jgi:hypothetical protein
MRLLMLRHRFRMTVKVGSPALLRVACSHGRQADAAIGVPRSTRRARRSRRTKRLMPTFLARPKVPVNLDRTPGHAMREFVGFFLRDLRVLRGGSNWGVSSTPRSANDNRLASVNECPPKRAPLKRHNRLRLACSQPKEDVSVPRDFQGGCDKPLRGFCPRLR